MIVLHAVTTAGHSLAFKVDLPPTPEDLARLAAIQDQPGVADATWSIKPGKDVRT